MWPVQKYAPKERLRCACDLLNALGQSPELPLPGLQEHCPDLGWGAWLGGRHTATTDRYKIYVEVPKNLPPPARRGLREALGRYQVLLESQAYSLANSGGRSRLRENRIVFPRTLAGAARTSWTRGFLGYGRSGGGSLLPARGSHAASGTHAASRDSAWLQHLARAGRRRRDFHLFRLCQILVWR